MDGLVAVGCRLLGGKHRRITTKVKYGCECGEVLAAAPGRVKVVTKTIKSNKEGTEMGRSKKSQSSGKESKFNHVRLGKQNRTRQHKR